MEDKTFELLTQMYNEFNNRFDQVDNRFDQVDNRLDKVENRLDKVENRLSRIEISIENDIKPDIKAALEGYRQLAEGQEEKKAQIIELSSRIDKQEIEITAIKRAK